MNKENDLKALLDRLKGEIRPLSAGSGASPEPPGRSQEEEPAIPSPAPSSSGRIFKPERTPFSGRPEFPRIERDSAPAGANLIWSENKETMLFGVLASLVAILGGILAGLDYVILIGTVSFMLFSFMMFLALFGYYLNFRKKNSEDGLLGDRVDQLSRRLEALAVKGLSAQSVGLPGVKVKDKELEQKVDELRALVKSLAKSVEHQNGGGR